MIWDDLVLKRGVDNARMADALAHAFEVAREAVLVVDRLIPGVDLDGILIRVERLPCKGEFNSRFSVAIRDDELARRLDAFDQKVAILRKLCGTLESACIVGALGLDPFVVPMVLPTGEVMEAELDDDVEDDEFIVLSSKSMVEEAA